MGKAGLRRLLAGLLLFALTACALPQPFRHDQPNPLLDYGALVGVVVLPVAGAPANLAATVADALTAQDIPAATESRHGGMYRLEGLATRDGAVVAVAWRLASPDGRAVGGFGQRVPLARWQRGDAAVAVAVAAGVAALLRPAPARAALPPSLRIAVTGVTGAPGDGDTALAAGLRQALHRLGLTVVEAGAAVTVRGTVSSAAAPAEQVELTIAWTVYDAEGGEIAVVRQSGAVPAARVRGHWGGLAADIAQGGADGVAAALRSR